MRIAVTSGKGSTGKTTIDTSLAEDGHPLSFLLSGVLPDLRRAHFSCPKGDSHQAF
jgi:hypothetical protein